MADAATPLRRGPSRRGRERPESDFRAPADLEAEEALLGAMLLSADAVARGLETCTSADFYKPSYGLVFSAMGALAARGTPVDAVTVAGELGDKGLLEHVGDSSVLVDLQINTPSTATAGHYAKRVAALAAERRLLGHALDLAGAIRDGDAGTRDRALADIAGTEGDVSRIGLQIVREDLAELMANPRPPIEPELLARSDGKRLLVMEAVTIVHAEPTAGKSWLGAEAVRQVTAEHRTAAVLDYEGGGRTWAQRFGELGADVEQIALVDYMRPGNVPLHVVVRAALASDPALVVIDGLAAAMAQNALDEDKAADCLVWLRSVARAIALAGPAVLVIDHVVKDKDARGRWGRGSGAKLGEADAAFSLEVAEPYARNRAGSAYLRIAKDRHGAIGAERTLAAVVHFVPATGGLEIRIEPPPAGSGEWQGPTKAMDAVLDLLRSTGAEFSISALVESLKAIGKGYRQPVIAEAAHRLAADPDVAVVVRSGSRGSRIFRFDPDQQALLDDDEEPF